MSSSGAQHITIENGRITGSVRFESMRAAPAFGFRLKLEFRVSLDAIPELGRYALTDLDGELSVGTVLLDVSTGTGLDPTSPASRRLSTIPLFLRSIPSRGFDVPPLSRSS